MWYCGDKSKHIRHLKMLHYFGVKGMRRGGKNIVIMKLLMHRVERAANIFNLSHYIVKHWKPRKAIYL